MVAVHINPSNRTACSRS